MNITDEQLTGYIDAELTVAEMAEVKAALSQDPNLRARHDALKAATQGLQADMAALLSTAPKMPPLPPEAAMTGAPTAWMGGALAACAAALVAATIWIMQPTQISTAVRQGLASAAWADEDHAYLLIGGSDLTAVESFAKEIQSQL